MRERVEVNIVSVGRGFEQVGDQNCLVLSCGHYGMFLDCGQTLPLSGKDALDEDKKLLPEYLPNFSRLAELDLNILGVLDSHAHLDHIGGLEELNRRYPGSTILSSTFTRDVVRVKFFEEATETFRWVTNDWWEKDENGSLGPIVSIGPFEIQTFPVLHSVPGSVGFHISCGGRSIVYTGDLKTPGTPIPYRMRNFYRKYSDVLRAIGALGVDLLIPDVTNINEEGFAGIEESVTEALESIILKNKGRIYIGFISSNVWRARNIVRSAQQMGRQVYAAGSSLRQLLRIAGIDGCTPINNNTIPYMPKDAIIICTGCQGEEDSFLDRLARGDFGNGLPPPVNRDEDIVVIASDTIPVQEIRTSVAEMVGKLSGIFKQVILTEDTPTIVSQGAPIKIWHDEEGDKGELHVSGHGKQEDIAVVMGHLKPKRALYYHQGPELRGVADEFGRDRFGVEGILPEENETIEL